MVDHNTGEKYLPFLSHPTPLCWSSADLPEAALPNLSFIPSLKSSVLPLSISTLYYMYLQCLSPSKQLFLLMISKMGGVRGNLVRLLNPLADQERRRSECTCVLSTGETAPRIRAFSRWQSNLPRCCFPGEPQLSSKGHFILASPARPDASRWWGS